MELHDNTRSVPSGVWWAKVRLLPWRGSSADGHRQSSVVYAMQAEASVGKPLLSRNCTVTQHHGRPDIDIKECAAGAVGEGFEHLRGGGWKPIHCDDTETLRRGLWRHWSINQLCGLGGPPV